MRPWDVNKVPRMKERRRLPMALAPKDVKAIFDAIESIKYNSQKNYILPLE